MRKLHKVALVVAAAGGLSATGAGPGFADAPAPYNGGAPLPVSQPDAQAASYTGSQATARTYGTPAPQRATAPATEVTPQLNPTLNPQLNPQISPSTVAPAPAAPQDQGNLFRPYQECSPQSLLDANLPVALLANAETKGVNCTQANSQANSMAHASR